jgi:hypothetical protein
MTAYWTMSVTDDDGEDILVYTDIDPDLKPFEITLESIKHAKFLVFCAYCGAASPWVLCNVPVPTLCVLCGHESTVKSKPRLNPSSSKT